METDLLMCHLAALEHNENLYLVTRGKKSSCVVYLSIEVVLLDLAGELYLFDLNLLLIFLGFLLLLFALESELSVVHDPCNGGSALRSDENEVEPLVIRRVKSAYGCKYSELFAVLTDNSYLSGLCEALVEYLFIYQMFFLTCRLDGKAPPSLK